MNNSRGREAELLHGVGGQLAQGIAALQSHIKIEVISGGLGHIHLEALKTRGDTPEILQSILRSNRIRNVCDRAKGNGQRAKLFAVLSLQVNIHAAVHTDGDPIILHGYAGLQLQIVKERGIGSADCHQTVIGGKRIGSPTDLRGENSEILTVDKFLCHVFLVALRNISLGQLQLLLRVKIQVAVKFLGTGTGKSQQACTVLRVTDGFDLAKIALLARIAHNFFHTGIVTNAYNAANIAIRESSACGKTQIQAVSFLIVPELNMSVQGRIRGRQKNEDDIFIVRYSLAVLFGNRNGQLGSVVLSKGKLSADQHLVGASRLIGIRRAHAPDTTAQRLQGVPHIGVCRVSGFAVLKKQVSNGQVSSNIRLVLVGYEVKCEIRRAIGCVCLFIMGIQHGFRCSCMFTDHADIGDPSAFILGIGYVTVTGMMIYDLLVLITIGV